MSDIKGTSFRINEDDNEKFKQFLGENGFNTQAEAFKAIMQTVEMAKAKNLIKDRAKEVETFQNTINELMGYFLNSLNVNQNSEERIREELSKELITKDNTINTMYDQLQKLKEEKTEMEKVFKEKSVDLEKAKEAILDWMDKNDKLKKDSDDKQKSIDVLTRNNLNQMEQLEEYRDLKSTNDLLLNELEESKSKSLSLENNNKQLTDKLSNTGDMISFYKDNILELKNNVEQCKLELKDLEIKHNKQVEEVKVNHVKTLEKEINSITEHLNDKYDLELSKKNIEIEKLKNNEDQYNLNIKELESKHNKQLEEIKVEHAKAIEKEINKLKKAAPKENTGKTTK